jgi:hypothetical protein
MTKSSCPYDKSLSNAPNSDQGKQAEHQGQEFGAGVGQLGGIGESFGHAFEGGSGRLATSNLGGRSG